jgi:anti-anti-sigma factor
MSVRPARFTVDSDRRGGAVLLKMTGELDIATVPQAERAIEDALAAGSEQLIVDLRELAFIDSSGLRLFIVVADRAQENGWELTIVRPPEPARTVFRLTGAEGNLPFADEPPAP